MLQEEIREKFEHHLSVNLTVCAINAVAVKYGCADGLTSETLHRERDRGPALLGNGLLAATAPSASLRGFAKV